MFFFKIIGESKFSIYFQLQEYSVHRTRWFGTFSYHQAIPRKSLQENHAVEVLPQLHERAPAKGWC